MGSMLLFMARNTTVVRTIISGIILSRLGVGFLEALLLLVVAAILTQVVCAWLDDWYVDHA